MRNERLRSEDGFGMLEVMVAGALMTITVLLVFGSTSYVMRSQRNVAQLSSFDASVSGITRVLASNSQCATAFKSAASATTMLQVPLASFASDILNVPEISVGSTILARHNQPLASGMAIQQLVLWKPTVLAATIPCATGTCNQLSATLLMMGRVTVPDGGTGGASERRQRWLVTFQTNPSDGERIVGCSGVPGTGGTPIGAGTTNVMPLWMGAGTLGNSGITTSSGRFGMGTTTVGSGLAFTPQLHLASDSAQGLAIEAASPTASDGPALRGHRARGTLTGKVMVQSGDELMSLMAYGWDGSNYALGAYVGFISDGTPGANDMPTRILFRTARDGTATTNVETMVIKSNSFVGIGNDAPAYMLDVNGIINVSSQLHIGGAMAPTCTPGGCQSSSDRRLKRGIRPLENSLARLLELRGVSFEWIDRLKYGDGRQIGLIAQEVRKTFPEVVVRNGNEPLRVAYDFLVAPLIEAIKELHAKATGRGERIAALERENESLRERIRRIRDRLRPGRKER
jgi:hypothetical protein